MLSFEFIALRFYSKTIVRLFRSPPNLNSLFRLANNVAFGRSVVRTSSLPYGSVGVRDIQPWRAGSHMGARADFLDPAVGRRAGIRRRHA